MCFTIKSLNLKHTYVCIRERATNGVDNGLVLNWLSFFFILGDKYINIQNIVLKNA